MITKTFPIAERLVANGLDLIRQLQQLLMDEATLLKQSDQLGLLNDLVQKKQPLINQINQFSRQMAQVLTTEKLPNDQDGMIQYLEKAKAMELGAETIIDNWTKIIEVTQACQVLNEQNGGSIDILRRHTIRSLHIIKGGPQPPDTYNKDGSTKIALRSRRLMAI